MEVNPGAREGLSSLSFWAPCPGQGMASSWSTSGIKMALVLVEGNGVRLLNEAGCSFYLAHTQLS